MTALGVGVDIVEYRRIRGIRFLERFSELCLTAHERAQLAARADKIEFIASRFAAKEAVIKSFPLKVTANDFEIRKNGGIPSVYYFNPRHRQFRTLVSLSHSSEYAAGYAQTYTL